MVQPVPPNITEPLSVCSRRVRLDGMGRGAVVELRGTGGRQLGRWTATWPDELFDLDPGVQLKPGELVWARQTSTAGEVSGWTTYPQATQEATPSTPMFDLPVVACAQEVSVSAVTPGSVGLQDNDEAATTAGSVWRQKPVGGDGKRQVVVGGRYLLHSGNDSPPLQWSEVTPAGVGPSHEVRRPPPGLDGSLPTFESFVSAVVAPGEP
jgi:hypothetical protein